MSEPTPTPHPAPGGTRWPMVVLTGLACGVFCGLFPVLVLSVLRLAIPGLGQ